MASISRQAPQPRFEESCAAEERELLAALQRGDASRARTLANGLTGRHPERGIPWKVFGALLWADGRVEDAVAAMRHSARLLPRDAEAHCNLGLTLAKLERFAEAEASLLRAIEIDPGFSIAHYRLGMTYSLQARLEEAEISLRRGIELRSDYAAGADAQNFSNLLFILSHKPGLDADLLFAEHRRYSELFESPLLASWPRHANARDPDRRLKIGFVSGDLYEHSVGRFFAPVAAQLQLCAGLELHAYCANAQSDAQSARLRSHFRCWTLIDALPDDALAARIAQDGIDVLIDLSGHTAHNRLPLFARKPAPLQVSWLGYPGTTGLRAMDYYLADRNWLPPGECDRFFTEKLAYLPARWAFEPHAESPPVGPLPALSSGRLTFGSFHRLDKINTSTVDLWSRLLLALPQTRLVLAGMPGDGRETALLDRFAAHGIARDRLLPHVRCAMGAYLGRHHEVDIALDTRPYCGATTTMHSLWMGVPTLTMTGSAAQSRAGAGIAANAGLDGFIAADDAAFVELGRHWAGRLPELAALRAESRARLAQSPAGRPDLIAAHIDAALRRMWHRWCAGLPADSF